MLAPMDLEGDLLEHRDPPASIGVGLADLLEAEQRHAARAAYRSRPACSSMRLRVRLAHSISARSWASEASRTMSITNPIHERTGSGGPGALTQQLQALALILAQRLAQLRHVLLARGRDLRLDFHARGLARGERFQPHPQRLGGQLGGAVDGALQARVLGIALDHARDQARPLELVEHPVEALGVDRPRGAQTSAQAGTQVVAMAGTLQHETKDRALQRRGAPHPGPVAGGARTVRGLVIDGSQALCGHLGSRSSLRPPLRLPPERYTKPLPSAANLRTFQIK